MSKAKKIISMLLAVAMVLTAAPVTVFASAADVEYTYGDVSFSKTDFSVDTSATTDVIRVAHSAGSFSLPTPGTAGQIVAATPSGIPKADTGNYIQVAYAKETPAFPQISFKITGATPDAVPTIVATGLSSNPTITHNDGSPAVSADGNTRTYTWTITNGTAMKGQNAVFEITYKIKGTAYKAYAFSHVEHILIMGGWVGHLTRTNGTNDPWRHAIIMQLQSKNMYTDHVVIENDTEDYYSGMNNPGTNNNAIGYINYASEGAMSGGSLKGCGNEDNLNGETTAYAASAPITTIPGTEVGALIKFRKEQSGGRYNGCFGNDGHTSEPIVYIDRRNESIRNLNMRVTFQYGEQSGFQSFTVQEMTFHTSPHTFGSEDYDFTSSASAAQLSAVNLTSGTTNSATVNVSAGFGAYVMVPLTGTGPDSSTNGDNPWGITADIYCNDTYLAGSMNLDFRIYDSTVLWNVYYGCLNGKALDGAPSYTTPSNWASAPNFECNFSKGAHPQASMYTDGWDNYLAKLKTAGSLLAAPDVTQAQLDTAAVELYVAYDALQGYNANVEWEIKHCIEGTTTELLPTQTSDSIEPIADQPQPAGSVWYAEAATIKGYELSKQSTPSQQMTISGFNAKETFIFYYKAREYNLVVDPNTDTTNEDNVTILTPYQAKVYEDSLDYGTKEFYTFDGWYYDDGVWSQPVFSDDVSEGGMRYFEMPNTAKNIYAKWIATPIDIEYVPIANGVELEHVFLDGDEVEFDGGTTATFNRPADLNLDGYLFVNYYADKELTTAATFPMTFTLGETENPYKIYVRMVDVNGKISFESNGGTNVPDINFTAGQSVSPESAPYLKGYTFAGWYTKEHADAGIVADPPTPDYFTNGTQANGWTDGTQSMPNNTGFIAYAMYTPNPYTISFDLGTPSSKFDTESLESITGLADSAINPDDVPAAPKKFGYVFHHWELNGERYDLVTYPTEDITLTPYWVETDYSAFIDITAYEKLSGNYHEVSTAQNEDVITFRMTSQTNFYTGSSVFVFMYDKSFFELIDTDSAAFVLNEDNEYVSGINATHIGVTNDSVLPWPDSIITERNTYQAMMIAIDPQVTATDYTTSPMKDGEWLVEFQLRVKADATGTGKVYMSNDWTRTPDNIMGTQFYGWSHEEDEVYNTFNNVVIPDLDQAVAEITIEETVTPDTKVTLYPNGGAYADSAEFKEYTGRAETEILDYEAPTREGYELIGWTNRADSSVVTWTDEFYYPPEATPEAIYDANWEAKLYPITFYLNDTLSNVYYKLDVAYDSSVTAPPSAPAKEGYVFRAWVNTETGADTAFPYTCNGEASYYPAYDPSPNTKFVIKANYTNNMTGAAASTSKNYTGTTGYTVAIVETAGSAANTVYITPADLPVINGYEFDPANNTLPITGTIAPDGSLVLEVNYKASIINVTLDANGGTFADGSSTATISGPFQTAIMEEDLPAAPTRTGYIFTGYQGLTFTDGVSSQKYVPNRNYKAIWEAVKYTMTFDAGEGAYADGSKSKTAEVAMGGAIAAPEVPALLGYTFKGWSLNGGDPTASLGTLDAAEARNYTAVFEKTPFNVTYYIDGVADDSRSEIKYIGDTVTIAGEPAKYGYDFSGWTFGDGSEATNFTITEEGDIDIYGEFTAKTLNVTFDANGGIFDNDEAITSKAVSTVFDTTIKAPASNPTRAGYEFLGWAVSAEEAEAKNTVTSFPVLTTEDAVTYYAAWNATIWDYTVEFYYQDVTGAYGEAKDDETLTYSGQVESVVSYNAEDNKTGFTLDTANSTLSGTVSVEDPLVLKVKYARNQHTLNIVVDDKTTTTEVYFGAAVNVPADPTKAGYKFDGWSNYTEGMTMPDTDLTITATWTANQYTVTYYTDSTKSEVAYTRTAAYNSDYTVPSPDKAGHTFAGWMNSDGTASGLAAGSTTQIPLDGAEYYATWTVNSYKLVYRTNGGTFSDGTNTKEYMIPYGTAKADWDVPETPVRPGYTWNNWNTASAPATMPAEQVNIVGQWTQETYKVIFADSLSDEIYSEEPLTYGAMVSIPEPEKEGYEFLYWMDEEGNEVTPMDTMEDIGANGATVTYTAKWNALPFTITFVDTGDVAYKAITKNFGEAVGTVADPVKTGYTFKGWSTAIPETMPAEDLTITANWQINQYTITFVDTGDVAYEAITKDYKAAIGTVADPVKTGYTFDGWDTDIPETMPAEDLTITAKWIVNTYVITFADTGDSSITPITQAYGTAITAPKDPTKTGYTFDGWDTEIPGTMPATNMTITAKWKVNQYTISFVDTGDVAYADITKNFGEAVGTVNDPVKTGYRFVDWDKDIPETMPAEDTVITAIWAINEYSISFEMDGGDAIAPIVQNYNTDIDASAIVPTKTGYVFTGWVDANGDSVTIPEKMPAANLTLTATWELDQFTFTFVVYDGTEVAPLTQDYTSAIDADALTTEKEGYTFLGWSLKENPAEADKADLPATMPAEDRTYYAIWKINVYTVTFLDAAGEEFYSTELEYKATIEAPEGTPDKTHYSFVGWSLTEVALGTADTPVDTTKLIDFVNAAPTVIADDMTIYPAFDRVVVTLTLVAGSTAVVDTERATDPITGYIYGLRQKLKVATLTSEYLAVEGDGRLEVTPTMYGRCGTGTKVEVIDNVENEVVEVYYIIIFGDVNGDSAIDAADITAVTAENAAITNWSKVLVTEEYDYCKVLAADIVGMNDLDGDGIDDDGHIGDTMITANDATELNLVVLGYKELDQTSGVTASI